MQKVRQERFALRVALYLLKANGFDSPTKKHVLNFIRGKNLLKFPDKDLKWSGGSDSVWENDIAWKRKDLFMDGEIDSPERRKWRLTELGVRKVDGTKAKWLKLEDEAEMRRFLADFDYFTDDLVGWLLKISKGEDLHLRKP